MLPKDDVSLLPHARPGPPLRVAKPPLVLAVERGDAQAAVRNLTTESTKTTAFMRASALMQATYQLDMLMCDILCDAGALAACVSLGLSPFALACEMGDPYLEVAKFFFDRDSSACPVTPKLFCTACANGHVGIVAFLLGTGAKDIDANVQTTTPPSPPFTALMHAASRGQADIVSLLLSHGATANLSVDERMPSAIELAEQGGFTRVVALLEPFRLPSLAALLASIEGQDSLRALETWVAFGGSPSYRFMARTADGRVRMPLLAYAAMRGELASVEKLLDMGARVNAAIVADEDEAPSDGQTPFMCAVAKGHDGVARALLRNGANPAIATCGGATALGLACPSCLVLVEQALRERGRPTERSDTPVEPEAAVEVAAGAGLPIMNPQDRPGEAASGVAAQSATPAPAIEEVATGEVATREAIEAVEEPAPLPPDDAVAAPDDADAAPDDADAARHAEAAVVPAPDAAAGVGRPPQGPIWSAIGSLRSDQSDLRRRLAAQAAEHERVQSQMQVALEAVTTQIEQAHQLAEEATAHATTQAAEVAARALTSAVTRAQAAAQPAAQAADGGDAAMDLGDATDVGDAGDLVDGASIGMLYLGMLGAEQQQNHHAEQQRYHSHWLQDLERRVAVHDEHGLEMLSQAQEQLHSLTMQVEQLRGFIDSVGSQQRHCLEGA